LLYAERIRGQRKSKRIMFIGWPHQTGRKQRPTLLIGRSSLDCANVLQIFSSSITQRGFTHAYRKAQRLLPLVRLRGDSGVASSRKATVERKSHDFREWSQTLDWIIRNIFKLPPLLDGHRSEQIRISNRGLSFLREVALVVQFCDECGKELTATEIATLCEIGGIDVPGCVPGSGTEQVSRRIGSLFSPLFKESNLIDVEGFEVTRIQKQAYDETRKEHRQHKFYCFKQN